MSVILRPSGESTKTGIFLLRHFSFVNSLSSSKRISWVRPRANAGIKTLPVSFRARANFSSSRKRRSSRPS